MAVVSFNSDNSKLSKAQDYFESKTPQQKTESLIIDLPYSSKLLWMTSNPELDLNRSKNLLFSGYSIDHTKKTITDEPDLVEDRHALYQRSGCFVTSYWDETSLVIHADSHAKVPIYASVDGDYIIASDSLLVVSSLRRLLRLTVSKDHNILNALRYRNSITAQTLSTRTMVSEISFLPPMSRIELDFPSHQARIKFPDLEKAFGADRSDYTSLIRQTALGMSGIARAILQHQPGSYRLGLTGGVDSRACLATLLATEEGRQLAVVSTANLGPGNEADFEVAQDLSRTFNFNFGERPEFRPQAKRIQDTFKLWSTDNIGSYFPLVQPGITFVPPGYFTVTGHGGELFSKFYGPRSLNELVESITSQDPVAGEGFNEAIDTFGANCNLDTKRPGTAE